MNNTPRSKKSFTLDKMTEELSAVLFEEILQISYVFVKHTGCIFPFLSGHTSFIKILPKSINSSL